MRACFVEFGLSFDSVSFSGNNSLGESVVHVSVNNSGPLLIDCSLSDEQ